MFTEKDLEIIRNEAKRIVIDDAVETMGNGVGVSLRKS